MKRRNRNRDGEFRITTFPPAPTHTFSHVEEVVTGELRVYARTDGGKGLTIRGKCYATGPGGFFSSIQGAAHYDVPRAQLTELVAALTDDVTPQKPELSVPTELLQDVSWTSTQYGTEVTLSLREFPDALRKQLDQVLNARVGGA